MQKGRQTAHVAIPYWMRDTLWANPTSQFRSRNFQTNFASFAAQEARRTGYTQCDGWGRVRASGPARGRTRQRTEAPPSSSV